MIGQTYPRDLSAEASIKSPFKFIISLLQKMYKEEPRSINQLQKIDDDINNEFKLKICIYNRVIAEDFS